MQAAGGGGARAQKRNGGKTKWISRDIPACESQPIVMALTLTQLSVLYAMSLCLSAAIIAGYRRSCTEVKYSIGCEIHLEAVCWYSMQWLSREIWPIWEGCCRSAGYRGWLLRLSGPELAVARSWLSGWNIRLHCVSTVINTMQSMSVWSWRRNGQWYWLTS